MLMRILNLPRTAWWRFVDTCWAPAVLRSAGVKTEGPLKLRGRPVVSRHPDARIRLGAGVGLYSRPRANVLTLGHPCTLAARKPGAEIVLGEGAALSGATLVSYERIAVGAGTLIGAEAMIVDTDFHPLDPRVRAETPTKDAGVRPVEIGRNVFIGGRAIILKGVTIGDGAVIGAGAVVARDVPPMTIVAGNPAQRVADAPGSLPAAPGGPE